MDVNVKYDIVRNRDHYELYIEGILVATGDTYKECEETLDEMMSFKDNKKKENKVETV